MNSPIRGAITTTRKVRTEPITSFIFVADIQNPLEYIQQRLLPEVLPYFKATYLTLEIPNDSGPTYMRFSPQSQAPTLAQPKDCIRHPFGGHSLRLEQVFLDEMIRVLQLPS